MARKTKALQPPAPRFVLDLGRSNYTGEIVIVAGRPRPGLVEVDLVRLPGVRLMCGEDRITPSVPKENTP
jgi:hypothetical protein